MSVESTRYDQMNVARLLAVGVLACAMVAGALADEKKPDYAKLLIGKWEVTKLDSKKEMPIGSTVEFGKDGKVKITTKEDGKEEILNVTYKVEGDKIILTFPGPEGKKPPATIKKLTDKELITGDERGVTFEFKRKD